MKKLSLLSLYLLTLTTSFAQKVPNVVPPYEFMYYVVGEGGANGLTVTYNPDNGYYYCVQAGNADFPLEVFAKSGENLFAGTAGQDTRGFWYNPKLKCMEGTKYMGGTFKMYLDNNGYPVNSVSASNSSAFIPPTDQNQVVCNVAKGEMYSYDNGIIYIYNQKTNKLKKKLALKNCPTEWENVNPYAMIYTGYKNYEFGIYDVVHYKLMFFNSKGIYNVSSEMPADAPMTDWFRIGFANDRLFLYDENSRSWSAYKLF